VKEDTNEKLKQIKQSFRLMMNGPTSQSMREKGLEYKINWGVPFIQLRQMASETQKDYDLAIALWKEDIRECKILATLLMPADAMPKEVAEIWMEQTHSQEMAEMQAFNLYQYVPFGPELAFRWMASDQDVYQICAYSILSRLFMKKQEPHERAINEFLDQAVTALQSPSVGVRHAAMNAVTHFAELGLVYERMAHSALASHGLDVL
jgi:3-methyladenine DNA glycosylase AlkD